MTTTELIDQVKANLLITFDDDDQLIGALINAATSSQCVEPLVMRMPFG